MIMEMYGLMRLLINILLSLAIPVISIAQECKSFLIIHSDIENIRVFINDSLEFKNQFEIELSSGEYNISILEDSDRWDAKSFHNSFNIDSCETMELSVKFSSEILIDSDPQDAQVLAGDSLLGYTPLLLPQNFSRITLKKNGYAGKEISIDQHQSKISASLEFIGKEEKENFLSKPIAKVLFGTMIAFGATAAYFKIQADNNFDDYLKTGELKYKDRTEQYDLISGISLGLTQINFGYLIYKIFIDE